MGQSTPTGPQQIIRLPRSNKVPPRTRTEAEERLADLDAELRTIDQSVKALAARKLSVLSKYRQALRQINSVTLVTILIIAGCSPSKHCRHPRGIISSGPAVTRGNRLLLGRPIIPI